MNAQQAENLRTLIRHMETKCNRVLNMQSFAYSCGAPACAIGELRTLEHFKEQIQYLTIEEWAPDVFGWRAGNETWARLFGRSETNAWRRGEVTPQEWAAEARKVLAEHGYTMDNKAAEFVAGLERLAREPLPVTTEHGTALFPK